MTGTGRRQRRAKEDLKYSGMVSKALKKIIININKYSFLSD